MAHPLRLASSGSPQEWGSAAVRPQNFPRLFEKIQSNQLLTMKVCFVSGEKGYCPENPFSQLSFNNKRQFFALKAKCGDCHIQGGMQNRDHALLLRKDEFGKGILLDAYCMHCECGGKTVVFFRNNERKMISVVKITINELLPNGLAMLLGSGGDLRQRLGKHLRPQCSCGVPIKETEVSDSNIMFGIHDSVTIKAITSFRARLRSNPNERLMAGNNPDSMDYLPLHCPQCSEIHCIQCSTLHIVNKDGHPANGWLSFRIFPRTAWSSINCDDAHGSTTFRSQEGVYFIDFLDESRPVSAWAAPRNSFSLANGSLIFGAGESVSCFSLFSS